MFDALPPVPFPAERKKGGPNITPGQIRRIRSLRKQGFKIKKIAELVGVTTQTVHRHLKKK
jgi:DNA invertase Pin-like site-specific DNA recombinase